MTTRERLYVPLDCAEQWRRYLASADHWRPRYSAYELAHSWVSARTTERGLPPPVQEAIDKNHELAGLSILLAFPEHRTSLEGGVRASQTDLWCLASCSKGLVSIAVEGKVREPFGETVAEWLSDASARSGKPARLAAIRRELGLGESVDLSTTYYQLLHRTAAAVIEARRCHALYALMLVHSFHGDKHFEVFAAFSGLFGAPVRTSGVHRVAQLNHPSLAPVTLYLGWAKDAPR
jgi:hypothetical protein